MTGKRRKGSPPRKTAPASDAPPQAPTAKGRRAARSKDVSLSERLGPAAGGQTAQGSVLPGSPAPTSRRAARNQRKQQARKRWAVVAAVVVGVLVLGLIAAWWLGRDPAAPPAAPAASRTERTLTMTLAEPGRPATSGVLLVTDPAASSADGILVPSQLLVSGPTPEGLPFGGTVLMGSPSAPGDALANGLNVIVDGTWQVSSSQLSALVDGVGGVLVDVDVDILTPKSGGPQKVVVAAGDQQLLTGAQAVAFAQYLAPGEPEEARLARFSQVIDQLTRRLPNNQADVQALLTQTKADSQATGTAAELSNFLVTFGNVSRQGQAGFEVIPTTPLDTGGPRQLYDLDPVGVERLRQTVLAGSVPTGASGQNIKVFVQNGVGTPGLVVDAGSLLRADGYAFVNGGNANSFANAKSDVLIPDSSPASVQLGQAVAKTLGLPASSVQVTDQGSSVADVIVILGADFNP